MNQESYWYHYIYNVDKLTGYHNFESEHKKTLSGETNYRQMARKFMLTAQLLFIFGTSFIFPTKNMLIYFTNWTLLIQTASLYSTIKAIENPKFSNDIQHVAWNHLLYSISIIFNFIVVSVYWTMLYQETIKMYYPNHPIQFI